MKNVLLVAALAVAAVAPADPQRHAPDMRRINMWLKLQKTGLLFTVIVTLILIAQNASAQNDAAPKKRLHSPAIVKGIIGGESHDSYVIKARKGQIMTVHITWRRKGDNRAEFTVSESDDFFNAEPVEFGKSPNHDERWRGKITKTRDYYIYVTGHPEAHYTLKVATTK